MSSRLIRSAPRAMLLSLISVVSLTACATRPPAPCPAILLPPSALEPCAGAEADTVAAVQDIAAFALEQEAAVQACEIKRQALVETVAGH